MRLADLLIKENIIPELEAGDKNGVLEELAGAIAGHDPSIEKNALVKVLLDRERLGSTGIGEGIAIPHGKFSGIHQPIISFGRSRKGLDFEAMDGGLVYLFFLLVAPENSASIHLQVLAKIAKILKNIALREALLEAPGRSEIYRIIVQNDEEF
ncbi:MAG: PTS sugar transporter subunit IIA [Desulfobacteraceae bacterium]|nr:MAG: PTS sugar transporter subunit IIA [Desulfobacteraceae bacterium]